MKAQISSPDSLFKGKSFREGQKLAKIGLSLILSNKKFPNFMGKRYQSKVMV